MSVISFDRPPISAKFLSRTSRPEERNELCIWITSHPYGNNRAAGELCAAMSDFDRRSAAGQIQIFDHDEWYAKHAVMSTAEKIQCLLSQRDAGVALGYAGLRCSGNTSFLTERIWEEFLVNERAVNEAFTNQSIIRLCSYGLDTCSAEAVADVMRCHQFGLAKRHGRWRLIEVRRQDHKASAVAEPGVFTTSGWRCGLRWLIEDQLAIYIGACPERISLRGGHVHLSESLENKLGPLFHELVINAATYGALSSTQGKLLVQWRVVVNGSRNLHIKWSESGICNLAIPNNIGLGTQLIAGRYRITRVL